MAHLGSSRAIEFIVSFAPITKLKSHYSNSSLISSISNTISYGTPASANNTFNYPGILPATGWIANLTLTPFATNYLVNSAIGY